MALSYDGAPLLASVNLRVPPGEVVALLGPSGAGKSSLLRAIAGPAGRRIGGYGPLGRRRRHPGAGPPATVRAGVPGRAAVPPPRRRRATSRTASRPEQKAARRGRVDELLGCSWIWRATASRPVATLSGGEAQRVALARALAPAPRLLLLDEPFGALDRELRDRLAVDVRDLLHRLGTPAVHVTHDLTEAELVADRVVRLVPITSGNRSDARRVTPRWFDPPEGLPVLWASR